MISDAVMNSFLASIEQRISTAFRPGTLRNQQHILFGYISTALTFNMDFRNPPVILILLYIEHLARSLKTASSVNSNFSSLKALMARLKLPLHTLSHPFVGSMLRSIGLHKRTVTFQRPPASTDVILKILRFTDRLPHAMQIRFAILLLFTTNMRQSNIFPASQRLFDPHRMLLRKDVVLSSSSLTVTNKWSKASQQISSLRYQTIPRATYPQLCTWRVARAYFARFPHRHTNQPLIHFDDMSPIPIYYIVKRWNQALTAAGLDPSLTLHSLRRGGASYLQEAGVPIPDVAKHGGWRSAAILRYTRSPSACSTTKALRDLV